MKPILLTLILFPFLAFSQIQIGQDIDGEAPEDFSGEHISISSNGKIVAIGAVGNDGNGGSSGHVRIYENQDDVWTQIGQDIDGEAQGDLSGRSVSLSSDGSIVAIGANSNDGNGMDSGHVRVYENLDDVWIQIGQDIDGEFSDDRSGIGLSLSSDGNIVAIGANSNDDNGMDSGHVRIYQNQGGNWVQIGGDIDGEASKDFSGNALSLSSNGNIVAIGATHNDFGDLSNTGHIRVFENIEGTWTQIGQDIVGLYENGKLGTSVSLSSDGTIVATGSPAPLSEAGIVRVFRNLDDVWTQIGDDIVGEAPINGSGGSISLSGDGSIIAIGAIGNDGNGENSGHVRIYKNVNDIWIQIGQDIDGEDTFQHFDAMGLSLSSDNTTVAIGTGRNDGENGNVTGAVRVFDLREVLSINEFNIPEIKLYPNPTSDYINIKLQNENLLQKIIIYNSLGQIVKISTKTTITTSKLLQGLYIVEVITDRGKAFKKLIII